MKINIKGNIANILTIIRILLIPVFTILYIKMPENNLYIIIFIFAAFTDFLDGFLARLLKQTSSFGSILDQIADKLLIINAIILLINKYNTFYVIIPSMIIISREITISFIRQYSLEKENKKIKVIFLSKIKTTLQILSIIILFIFNHNQNMFQIGLLFFYISTILSIISLYIYIKKTITLDRKK